MDHNLRVLGYLSHRFGPKSFSWQLLVGELLIPGPLACDSSLFRDGGCAITRGIIEKYWSIDIDPKGFPKRRRPAGIAYPENWILGRAGIGMAAKIGKVNEANSVNAVFLDPLEYRTEVGASSAFGLQLNRFGRPKLLDSLDGGVAIDHVNAFGLRFIADGRDLTGELFQLFFPDRT